MAEDKKQVTSIALFQEKTVRRVWHESQWWFSVIDVIAILTNSQRLRKYWSDLKVKLVNEGYFEVSEKIGQLKMEAQRGASQIPFPETWVKYLLPGQEGNNTSWHKATLNA